MSAKDLSVVDSGEICVKILDMDTKQLLKKLDAASALLASIRSELDSSSVVYPSSVTKESAKGICHWCKKPIGDSREVRGLHEACNQFITREKKAGNLVESELITKGLIGPVKQGGRKKKFDVADMLSTQQAATAEADVIAAQEQPRPKRKGASKS